MKNRLLLACASSVIVAACSGSDPPPTGPVAGPASFPLLPADCDTVALPETRLDREPDASPIGLGDILHIRADGETIYSEVGAMAASDAGVFVAQTRQNLKNIRHRDARLLRVVP
jgi:hypothetical protein